MESSQVAQKKQKKDTGVKIEQWADTPDRFVNLIYKKLRNIQKKLNQIIEVETKIKAKEITPTPDQLEKVARKDKFKAEMDDVLSYLKMYQEANPDSLAFTQTA